MKLTTLILAGGIGKRLWPLTTDKALFDFAGCPIIDYVVEDLKATGITDLIIVANPDNQAQLRSLYPQAKITIQDKPTGMADGILIAQNLISGPVLIVNASDLLDSDAFAQIVAEINQTNPQILLTAKEIKEFLPTGYFKLEGAKPVAIVEKPQSKDKPSDLVKLVVDYFQDPQILFNQLKHVKTTDDAYEQAVTRIIKNQPASLYHYSGQFNQLKYPWHVLSMTETILNTRLKPNQHPSASVHPTAVIDDNVVLSAQVNIMAHATVKGPSFIGSKTIIGNNALIRQSMIGANSVIGYNTEIARSWVGDNCWFHSNYIGDSILEQDTSFGGGALTANFRLDQQPIKDTGRIKLGAMIGQGVRVGVNTSIMPGIKLGHHSVVGPGLVLNQDLTDNQTHFK